MSICLMLVTGGCRAGAAPPISNVPSAVKQEASPQAITSVPTAPSLPPPPSLPTPVAPLPESAVGLLAITQDASTTIMAVDPRGQLTALTERRVLDTSRLSFQSHVLAYLVLAGLDPADNFMEIINLVSGDRWRVHPSDGLAIFAHTLSPDGHLLVYLEVAMRGSGPVPSWQVLIFDVEEGRSRLVLRSGDLDAQGGERGWAAEPILWSDATGEIYFQALVPYKGYEGHGIWAMRPDGSNLHQILEEASYLGTPQLSPDGLRLAYLATDLTHLSLRYWPISGGPPAHLLKVISPLDGQETLLAQEEGEVYGGLAWSPHGSDILLSRGAWQGSSFRYRIILSVAADGSEQQVVVNLPPEQPGTIVGFHSCSTGGLLYLIREERGTRLMMRTGAASTSLLLLPQSKIEIIACLQ
ncbi:MAG: TolB family protein [Anaerolineae bacterium]